MEINPESPEMAAVNLAEYGKMTEGESVGYLSKRMAILRIVPRKSS